MTSSGCTDTMVWCSRSLGSGAQRSQSMVCMLHFHMRRGMEPPTTYRSAPCLHAAVIWWHRLFWPLTLMTSSSSQCSDTASECVRLSSLPIR